MGSIHDQVTYSISPEYFTKFKYQQFGFDPAWFGGHRQTVAVIGFLATWWMGIIHWHFIGLNRADLSVIIQIMQRAIMNGIKITLNYSDSICYYRIFLGKILFNKFRRRIGGCPMD